MTNEEKKRRFIERIEKEKTVRGKKHLLQMIYLGLDIDKEKKQKKGSTS